MDQTTSRSADPTGSMVATPLRNPARPLGSIAAEASNGVTFSPDGNTIASASASHDWTVRLWDAATGQPVGAPLTGHTGQVQAVAFSPDGKAITSTSADQTVRLWPATVDAWIEHACTLAERNLRQDEWNQFVGHDRPYVRTCPDLPPGHGAPADAPAASYRLD